MTQNSIQKNDTKGTKDTREPKFSVPYNPFLSKEEILAFVSFINEHKTYIKDIYSTIRIPPFDQDAMGIEFNEEHKKLLINNSKIIEELTGVPISLTFNNICVSPSYDNYKIFIRHLKELKEIGLSLKSNTIPHTSWLRFGLREEMQSLNVNPIIKNTILHKVKTPAEVYRLFVEEFDYINVDRVLLRDIDTLKELKYVKEICQKKLNKKLYLSILINEPCEGYCPVEEDHFAYNLNKKKVSETFFHSEMKEVSCEPKEENRSELFFLKTANLIPDEEEFNVFNEYIDVYELHGRRLLYVFYKSLKVSKLSEY